MSEELKDLKKQLRENVSLPSIGSSGSSTATCYKVQARMCNNCPPVGLKKDALSWIQAVLTDTHWETLSFPEEKVGVPNGSPHNEFARYGYLTYTAAQALRWWFLAENRDSIETRLVEYQFEHSYKATPIKAVCLVDPEKRENIMPDWGKKNEPPKNI